MAKLPTMMLDWYLGNAATQPVRIDRNETVHLAIQSYAFDNVFPVSLQRTTVITELNAGDFRDQPVRDPAWQISAKTAIFAVFSPAGHDIVTFIQPVQE